MFLLELHSAALLLLQHSMVLPPAGVSRAVALEPPALAFSVIEDFRELLSAWCRCSHDGRNAFASPLPSEPCRGSKQPQKVGQRGLLFGLRWHLT